MFSVGQAWVSRLFSTTATATGSSPSSGGAAAAEGLQKMLVAARPDTGGDGSSSSSSTEEGAAAALPRATVVDGRFILTKEDFPDAAAANDELISGASGTSSRG